MKKIVNLYLFIVCVLISGFISLDVFSKEDKLNSGFEFSSNNQPDEINISKSNLDKILQILSKYDKKNAPKKIIKNGRIIYQYTKNANEPNKSLEELERLIKNPESIKKYEKFLRISLSALLSNGVSIQIKDLKNNDLSAQWIYKNNRILINKNAFSSGTKNFAYLISHEMIHISQSCNGGGINSYPVLIGLKTNKEKVSFYQNLQSSAYKDLNDNEIKLEIEAYSNQKELLQSLNLFKYLCLGKSIR